jgi:hypothetical protein
MNISLHKSALAAGVAAMLALSACGGGGHSDSPGTVTPPGTVSTTLTGTAAVGAPIAGSVFAIDSKGAVSPAATTNALGAFTIDVAGMSAPFILSVTGTAGGKQVVLNSIATMPGQTVNITPLTDLIVSTASGQPAGTSLANLCAPVAGKAPAACTAALSNATSAQKLDTAVAAVTEMIKPINTNSTNPLTGAFVANGTGMDAVLDQIQVTPADAQGAMATVTLIATNNTLGSVTLPANAGGTATIPTPTAPGADDLAKANAAATVLPEIRACMASLSALYPKTNFVAPSRATVLPFIDSSFNMGTGVGRDQIVTALTSTDDAARAGLTIEAVGLAPIDMQPLSTTDLATLTSTSNTSTTKVADFVNARRGAGDTAVTFTDGKPSSAWVQLRTGNDAGLITWKLVKTSDTSACAGGWKIAGNGHLDMHMNARIQRNIDNKGVASFTRLWAFHMAQSDLAAENADRADVRGPGLTTYGNFKSNGSASARLQLVAPAAGYNWLRIADNTGTPSAYYGNGEALQSCQDIAAIAPAPAGLNDNTMCIDETKTAPGKIYVWTLRSGSTVVSAFPFQTNAVPLSLAFAQANQASLFATITSVTPAKLSSISADTLLDNVVTYNYTQTATYGAKMDNCGLALFDASGTVLLNAEQNAVSMETACTFSTKGLNSLVTNVPNTAVPGTSLFKFTGTATSGYINVTSIVLGNQASSSQAYAN